MTKSNNAIKTLLVKIKKAAAALNAMLDKYEVLKLKEQAENKKAVKSKSKSKAKPKSKSKAKTKKSKKKK